MSDFPNRPPIDSTKPWLKLVPPPASTVTNVGSVAMGLAKQGDWDGFEAYLDKFDDSQLKAFVNFYNDLTR